MVNTPDHQNQAISKIVIERIQVLAVAQDVSSNENKPRVVNAVTLQVTPQQAEQIDLARSVGTLSLVLRSQSDQTTVVTEGARKLDLLKKAVGPEPHASALHAAYANAKPVARKQPSVAPAPMSAPASTSEQPAKLEVIRGMSLSQE